MADREVRMQAKIDELTERVRDIVAERDHLAQVNAALTGALSSANEAMAPLSTELEQLRRFKLATEQLGQGTVKPADIKRVGNYVCLKCGNQWFVTAITVREDGAPTGRLSVGTCNECGTDQVLAPRKEQPE